MMIVDLYLKIYTGAQDSLTPEDCIALISQPGLAFIQNEVTRTIACPTERAKMLSLAMDADIHACILLALHTTGLKHSIPTSILKHMRSQVYVQSIVDEHDWDLVRTLITTEHIKSHLQKHRLRAQRSPEHILKKLGIRIGPASARGALHEAVLADSTPALMQQKARTENYDLITTTMDKRLKAHDTRGHQDTVQILSKVDALLNSQSGGPGGPSINHTQVPSAVGNVGAADNLTSASAMRYTHVPSAVGNVGAADNLTPASAMCYTHVPSAVGNVGAADNLTPASAMRSLTVESSPIGMVRALGALSSTITVEPNLGHIGSASSCGATSNLGAAKGMRDLAQIAERAAPPVLPSFAQFQKQTAPNVVRM
jgi:hypothetical protein